MSMVFWKKRKEARRKKVQQINAESIFIMRAPNGDICQRTSDNTQESK